MLKKKAFRRIFITTIIFFIVVMLLISAAKIGTRYFMDFSKIFNYHKNRLTLQIQHILYPIMLISNNIVV